MNNGRSTPPALTIRDLRTVAVEVPMTIPLGTSAATIRDVPLVLIDVETEEGLIGRTYLFCYRRSGARAITEILQDMADVVKGQRAAPVEIVSLLARSFALIGVTGVVRMALSGLDAALWDALATAAGVPLASLLGGGPRPLRVYNSNGLGLIGAEKAAEQADKLIDGGFKAVKLRLGYPTLAEDVAVTTAVRQRLPDEIHLMVDYNQALSVSEAQRRGKALESAGVYWLEEPIRHDDYAGNAVIARDLDLPVQMGENFNGPQAMMDALSAGACDYVMPDLGRIGGVTGWMQAAGIAAAQGIEMSSHLFPEVSSHLLAATQTCGWLEYVDWANPILEEPLVIRDGEALVPDRPGSGLVWNDQAVAMYRIT
jgi:mandelate racemase